MWWRISGASCLFLVVFIAAMWLKTTTTSGMHCNKLKICGWLIGGSVRYLLSLFSISEVNKFLIIRYFVYCGLHQKGFPTLLEFFWKLAWQIINNIYIGELERGWERYFQNPFIGWWLYQGMLEDIRIGGGFPLQKMPINSTSADLNAVKR